MPHSVMEFELSFKSELIITKTATVEEMSMLASQVYIKRFKHLEGRFAQFALVSLFARMIVVAIIPQWFVPDKSGVAKGTLV